MAKWVYLFEEVNKSEEYAGNWERVRGLLGLKGAILAKMTSAGLPVPPWTTVSTEACKAYHDAGEQFPTGMREQMMAALKTIERQTGKGFGDSKNPLLVSIRSGATLAMPGMMETILNLGLNDSTLDGLIKNTSNPRFAYDAYRRFIQLFGKIVLGVDEKKFDQILNKEKKKVGAVYDTDLNANALKNICKQYLNLIKNATGSSFPKDPRVQLESAIEAFFKYWMEKRAVDYRREFKITPEMANGTAVTICAMVFGNMGPDSATGVAFTRDLGTGDNVLNGEYLVNAQGEDVVAGIRTPKPISDMKKEMPKINRQLKQIAKRLEQLYLDVQDFEFVIERGKLWILTSRTAYRRAYASLRLAIDFLDEGLISEKEAIFRVRPDDLAEILIPKVAPNSDTKLIVRGLGASSGVTSGTAVFDAQTAERLGENGKGVILVCDEIKPEDINGLSKAQGLITSRGGKTSHGAVVSRGMSKPCVVGAPIGDFLNKCSKVGK